ATGHLPFDGPTIYSVINQISSTEPQPPSALVKDLPEEFDRIIGCAMAKEKEERYSTAAELAEALQKLRAAVMRPPQQKLLVAVLYFENLSREKDEEYFRDGITEDIITELSKIKDLMVL